MSITGPVVARGYRRQARTIRHSAAPTAIGYRTFLTDDLAVVDGGRWRIVGRIDDVIITGGIKIDPAVVEAVLLRVAGVAEVIVTGVPDPAGGSRWSPWWCRRRRPARAANAARPPPVPHWARRRRPNTWC